MEGLWWQVNQTAEYSTAGGVVGLGMRPLRMFAPFMAVGAALFAVAAIFLLAQGGAGVVIIAEGAPGTAITMPGATNGSLDVYAATRPGQPIPDVKCDLMTTTRARANQTYGRLSVTSKGMTLHPVWAVTSGWRAGDTLTCTGTGFETVTLGRNNGLTHLLQGLVAAFVAVGSGIFAIIGFASRRRMG